jgi:hypothetical protein
MAGAWTAAKERRAIVAHVARCRFCAALLSHGASRRDRELLAAADSLASDHAADEEERIALSGRRR